MARVTRRTPAQKARTRTARDAAPLIPQIDPVMPRGKDPGTGFRIPPPRGVRPRGATVTPEEEARLYSSQPVDLGRTQGRRPGASRQLTEEAMAAAAARQRGEPLEDEREPEEPEDQDALGEPEEPEYDEPDAYDPRLIVDPGIARGQQHAQEQAQFSNVDEADVFGAPPVERRAAVASKLGLVLAPIFVEDTDRLWDWIRQDDDRGEVFFGRPMRTTADLHTLMKASLLNEKQGTGLVRSIRYTRKDGTSDHIGTAVLQPILAVERIALMHLYLRQDVRGNLPKFAPVLLREALDLVPGYHLAFFALSVGMVEFGQKVMVPLGFSQHTMFVL